MVKEILKTDIKNILINKDKNELQLILQDGYKPKYNFNCNDAVSTCNKINTLLNLNIKFIHLGYREKNILENLLEVVVNDDKTIDFFCVDKNKPYGVNDSFTYYDNKVIS